LIAALLGALGLGGANVHGEALPDMGAARPFSLTTQDGDPLSLADLRGKVVLVAFIYASCKDVCLTETAKMVMVQNGLGKDFGSEAYFISVTMDPEVDTGDVLKQLARQFGAQLDGWSFLTGSTAKVRQVAHDYGVVFRKTDGGDVEHNTLASIIDRRGHLRVQYMGVDFYPEEMLADIREVMQEGSGR
jgi:protein SCO1/2